MDMLKKIFSLLSVMPNFASLFSKASKTGKLDPIEVFSAISSISPSMGKCAESAMETMAKGGNIKEALQSASNFGEIEVGAITGNKGQTVNTKTIMKDLRNVGEPDSVSRKFGVGLANLIEQLPNQSAQDTVNFGNAAANVKNWQELVK